MEMYDLAEERILVVANGNQFDAVENAFYYGNKERDYALVDFTDDESFLSGLLKCAQGSKDKLELDCGYGVLSREIYTTLHKKIVEDKEYMMYMLRPEHDTILSLIGIDVEVLYDKVFSLNKMKQLAVKKLNDFANEVSKGQHENGRRSLKDWRVRNILINFLGRATSFFHDESERGIVLVVEPWLYKILHLMEDTFSTRRFDYVINLTDEEICDDYNHPSVGFRQVPKQTALYDITLLSKPDPDESIRTKVTPRDDLLMLTYGGYPKEYCPKTDLEETHGVYIDGIHDNGDKRQGVYIGLGRGWEKPRNGHKIYLFRDGEHWMDTSNMERTSMLGAIRWCPRDANVFVGGLGLGLFPMYLARSGKARNITVAEIDDRVIKLVGPRLLKWCRERYPGTRITILHGDALKLCQGNGTKYDYTFMDIWKDGTSCKNNRDLVTLAKISAERGLKEGGRVSCWKEKRIFGKRR